MRSAAIVAAIVAIAFGAAAHALFRHAVPAPGATVRAAPRLLTIELSEGVEPDFCTVTVVDAGGTHVEQGKPHLVGGEATQLGEDLPPLSPGTYTVTWHATSVDTHKTQGSYQFTVAP